MFPTLIDYSVTDLKWIDRIKQVENEVLVIAEGLFMYLSENEIKAVFGALKLKFESYTIVFDAFSKLTAKSSKNHPSLNKTGASPYQILPNHALKWLYR